MVKHRRNDVNVGYVLIVRVKPIRTA